MALQGNHSIWKIACYQAKWAICASKWAHGCNKDVILRSVLNGLLTSFTTLSSQYESNEDWYERLLLCFGYRQSNLKYDSGLFSMLSAKESTIFVTQQTTSDPSEAMGSTFDADVMKREKQQIFIKRVNIVTKRNWSLHLQFVKVKVKSYIRNKVLFWFNSGFVHVCDQILHRLFAFYWIRSRDKLVFIIWWWSSCIENVSLRFHINFIR